MKKEDKGLVIDKVAEALNTYNNFYLVNTEAMDAEATAKLRRQCFKAGIKMVVVKNTLFKKALEAHGGDCSQLYPALKGTTAVLFSEVANAPAKLLKEYEKDAVPALKAAYAEEGFYVGADQLSALVSIKSKNEVIADIVALLQSPAKNVISALTSGGTKLHGILQTLSEKGN